MLPASAGWTWRSSALLAVVLLHPYILVLAVQDPGVDLRHAAGTMSLLLIQVAILAAAAVLQYDWRISHRAGIGWLAVGLAFVAGQQLPFALLAVQGSEQGRYGYVVGLTQLPSSTVLLAMVVLARRNRRLPSGNPLTVGLVLGAGLGAARLALIDAGLDPSLHLTWAAGLAVLGGVTLLAAAIVMVLTRWPALPEWARARLVVFVACLLAGRALSNEALANGNGHGVPSPVAVMIAAVGAVALFSTAAGLLRQSIDRNAEQLADLAHRAASAEVSIRHGKERMHELHATVAGLAHASRVLMREGGPTGARRRRLENLLDAEMARLERMLAQRGRQPVGELSVDDVLLPLVETQRTLGTDVRFGRSGMRALGRPDDLAEATHILLSNAARHAPESTVAVTATRRGDTIEIRVSDDGPGIPRSLRDSLFSWGVRGADSSGQGIGLQLARRLMQEQAGSLKLENAGRSGGATFVLTIPASPLGLT